MAYFLLHKENYQFDTRAESDAKREQDYPIPTDMYLGGNKIDYIYLGKTEIYPLKSGNVNVYCFTFINYDDDDKIDLANSRCEDLPQAGGMLYIYGAGTELWSVKISGITSSTEYEYSTTSNSTFGQDDFSGWDTDAEKGGNASYNSETNTVELTNFANTVYMSFKIGANTQYEDRTIWVLGYGSEGLTGDVISSYTIKQTRKGETPSVQASLSAGFDTEYTETETHGSLETKESAEDFYIYVDYENCTPAIVINDIVVYCTVWTDGIFYSDLTGDTYGISNEYIGSSSLYIGSDTYFRVSINGQLLNEALSGNDNLGGLSKIEITVTGGTAEPVTLTINYGDK